MQKTIIAAAVLAAAVVTQSASADYKGPRGPVSASTVGEILKSPKDDTWVVLKGFLVRQTGKDRYLFSDGTGEIAIQIEGDGDDDEDGKSVLPAQPLDEKTRVEITGEIDKDWRKPVEIDVDALVVVQE